MGLPAPKDTFGRFAPAWKHNNFARRANSSAGKGAGKILANPPRKKLGAMAAHSRDLEATALQHFRDPRSKVCMNGAFFLFGADAQAAYDKAYSLWRATGRICWRCSSPVRGKPDWEHIIPKGNHSVHRDDHPRNRAFIHSMRGKENCHRDVHGREIALRWIPKGANA